MCIEVARTHHRGRWVGAFRSQADTQSKLRPAALEAQHSKSAPTPQRWHARCTNPIKAIQFATYQYVILGNDSQRQQKGVGKEQILKLDSPRGHEDSIQQRLQGVGPLLLLLTVSIAHKALQPPNAQTPHKYLTDETDNLLANPN